MTEQDLQPNGLTVDQSVREQELFDLAVRFAVSMAARPEAAPHQVSRAAYSYAEEMRGARFTRELNLVAKNKAAMS